MELAQLGSLELILAFWISGVFMAFIQLFMPAMRIVGTIDKTNIAYRYRFLGGVTFICLSTIFLPFLVHIILFENSRERFLQSFIPAFMGEK